MTRRATSWKGRLITGQLIAMTTASSISTIPTTPSPKPPLRPTPRIGGGANAKLLAPEMAAGDGETIDQRAILRRLAELQYKRNDVELHRGTYRVRGDVIDIYPADSDREAVRVELFDDEVDNIARGLNYDGTVVRATNRLREFQKKISHKK